MSEEMRSRAGAVSTDPHAQDGRLRGRTYAIPFARVWDAACAIAGGRARGWRLTHTDDQAGIIEAVHRTALFGREDEVRIRIGLDGNGQTRVDLISAPRAGGRGVRRRRRVIGSFLRHLDRSLDASDLILDPTGIPPWHPEAR